jgi:adenylosuccinate synthase
VAARFATRVNGLDALAVTKFDVLSGLDPLKIAVAYDVDGERRDTIPASAEEVARAVPVYEELPGWNETLTGARRLEELPKAARRYLDRLSELTECPVGLVSVGPDRGQTIIAAGGLLDDVAVT